MLERHKIKYFEYREAKGKLKIHEAIKMAIFFSINLSHFALNNCPSLESFAFVYHFMSKISIV